MPKTAVGADLIDHLQGAVTSVATLWRLERRDGTIMGFTDHVVDVAVGGVTYVARTGYARSAIDGSTSLAPDNLEIEGILDSDLIDAADVRAGVYDHCAVQVMLVNYDDLTMGTLVLRTGWLGEVQLRDATFVTELMGLSHKLEQQFVEAYSPLCPAEFADARCGLDAADWTETGTVTAISDSRRVFTATISGARPAGTFDGGVLTFTSGNNDTRAYEVKSLASGVITLYLAANGVIAASDTFSILAGCNKTFAACKTIFSNVENFRGFPHVPNRDRMLAYPDAKN